MRPSTKILAGGSIFLAIFCVSLFFSDKWGQKPQPLILTSRVINQPLPKARLVNISGQQLADDKLRRGKVILLFTMTDCDYCDEEDKFLRTVAGIRKDVSYIYVIPFGAKDAALGLAQSKYGFETFYDEGSTVSKSLGLLQVPIQVYLEDGIIKRTWVDATVHNRREDEYRRWLSSI